MQQCQSALKLCQLTASKFTIENCYYIVSIIVFCFLMLVKQTLKLENARCCFTLSPNCRILQGTEVNCGAVDDASTLVPNIEFSLGQVPQGMPITAAGSPAGACIARLTALFRLIQQLPAMDNNQRIDLALCQNVQSHHGFAKGRGGRQCANIVFE